MRVWHYQGVHRLAWVVALLLVLAVAVFVMAAGFSRLHQRSADPEPAHPGSSAWLDRSPAAWLTARAALDPDGQADRFLFDS